jgi:asparagine synthase (glutamine-hydrolysing)
MCGVAGLLQSTDSQELHSNVRRMISAIAHRGPDSSGTWVDAEAGLALGHCRLSILDLTVAGHQPMTSHSGRWVISFNGEIYNHGEIKRRLKETGADRHWKGHSDTEALLEAIDAWGIQAAVEAAVGMFAFAAWDKAAHELHLVRDRAGEKPMYYTSTGGAFMFASELRALEVHPMVGREIDLSAVQLFLRHGYVPTPLTIYKGIRKLPAGTILTMSPRTDHGEHAPRLAKYWSLEAITSSSRAHFEGTFEDANEEFYRMLTQSVSAQLVSDVPLGAFLSGGIDSTAVVAVAQQLSNRPVKTFSLGFQEDPLNETVAAKEIAKHLGTDHHEFNLTGSDVCNIVPELADVWDEPFADSSQIPTLMLSRLTRREVKVCLSGDGGDELFHGYPRYFNLCRAESIPLKRSLAGLSRAVSPALAAIPTQSRLRPFADRIRVLGRVFAEPTRRLRYRSLISHWNRTEQLLSPQVEPSYIFTRTLKDEQQLGTDLLVQAIDFENYLSDDILVKVDRAAMSVALETRIPLLDHRIIEFAFSLPYSYRASSGVSKRPLRACLSRFVPTSLIDRPKTGFGIPINSMLRNSLRGWAADVIASQTSIPLNEELVGRMWTAHLSGSCDWSAQLWDVLMLKAWAISRTGSIANHAEAA